MFFINLRNNIKQLEIYLSIFVVIEEICKRNEIAPPPPHPPVSLRKNNLYIIRVFLVKSKYPETIYFKISIYLACLAGTLEPGNWQKIANFSIEKIENMERVGGGGEGEGRKGRRGVRGEEIEI